MKSLIEFIYNGEVNIYQDDLAELLRIANILKIKGLDEIKSETPNKPSEEEVDNIESDENNLSSSLDEKIDLPSTSDQTKLTKKRKSVTFADTPEILYNQFHSNLNETQDDDKGNGKRKSTPLSNVCTITEIKTEYDQDERDSNDDTNDNKLVVKINPNSLCSMSETIDEEKRFDETLAKKQKIGNSRKMIRKNENFLHALEAVRDKGMGFCKAAKIYGVNNRTLWLEYQKLGYPMKNSRKKSQS